MFNLRHFGISVFVIIVAIICSSLWASDDYYNNTFLGEIDFKEYCGPVDSRFNINTSSEQVNTYDQLFYDRYLENNIQPEIFLLARNWIDETYPDIFCPNYYFAQNYDYIRYLYRLIGTSYLFEALREYNIQSYQLGINAKSCSLNWDDIFSNCHPKSEEMKKFLMRIKDRHLIGFEKARLVKQSSSSIEKWVENFNREINSKNYSSIVSFRIGQEFPQNENVNLIFLKNAFDKICDKEKKAIIDMCSERDEYYGFSNSGILTYLLQKSNTLTVINDGGYGQGCLKRFSRLGIDRENRIEYLPKISEMIYHNMKDKNIRYKQGNIFIAGALKEFDDRGLNDFIFVPKKEEKKVVVAQTPKPVLKPAPKPIPKIVVVSEIPKPQPVPVVKPSPKEIKLSQFEIARLALLKSIKNEIKVDMEKFETDFIFSDKVTLALTEPLKDFQTRQGLEDMKKWDKLGTKDEPVRLIFLKFLIDNNLHTGLFNITAVLGNVFYVINDIDKINIPVHTELKNDESTNYKWTLILHRD